MFSRSDKLISYLLLASIFTTAFTVVAEPRIPLAYILPVMALLYLSAYKKRQHYRKKYLLLALFGLGVHSIIAVLVGTAVLERFVQTYGLTVVTYLAFHLLLSKVPHHVGIIRCYVKICFFVALIGIFQYLSFLVGFTIGYDYSGLLSTVSPLVGAFGIRLASILSEPSHVAYCMAPALVLATYTFFRIRTPIINMPQACVIFIFAVLSQSSTVYVLLGVSFLTIPVIRKGKILLIGSMVAAFLLFSSSLLTSGFFQEMVFRFGDLASLVKYGLDSSNVNASSFTVYFNFKVAMSALNNSYGFGGGIGSHALAFDELYGSGSFFANAYSRTTAGGLINRLISELGIFGIIAVLIFFYVAIMRLRRLRGLYLILHLCFAIGVVGFLIRQGSYSQLGVAFYLLVFTLIPKLGLDAGSRRSG